MLRVNWFTWLTILFLLIFNNSVNFEIGILIEVPDYDKKKLLLKYLKEEKVVTKYDDIFSFSTDQTIFCPALIERSETYGKLDYNAAHDVVQTVTEWARNNLKKNEGISINFVYFLFVAFEVGPKLPKSLFSLLPKKLEIKQPRYEIRFIEDKIYEDIDIHIMFHLPYFMEEIMEIAKVFEKYNLFLEIDIENEFRPEDYSKTLEKAPFDIREWMDTTDLNIDTNIATLPQKYGNISKMMRLKYRISDVHCYPSMLVKENTIIEIDRLGSRIVKNFQNSELKYVYLRQKQSGDHEINQKFINDLQEFIGDENPPSYVPYPSSKLATISEGKSDDDEKD